MKGIEKRLSEYLRKYPGLRDFLKLSYQRIIYNLKGLKGDRKLAEYHPEYGSKAERITSMEYEHFFGYYDKSPWDGSGRYILVLRVPFSNRHPLAGEKAVIAMIDRANNNQFISLAETNTWNLQQGCMLQWLGPDYTDKIVYNDLINDTYVSVIYNVFTEERIILDRPLYTISPDGRKGLSLNFSRLHRLRPGYGYANLADRTAGDKHPMDDGIFYHDLQSNSCKLIISLDELSRIEARPEFSNVEHRVNHLDINTDGSRFSFLHRWLYKGETYSRLYTANIDGSDLSLIADNKMVSHSCWKNREELLVWAGQQDIGNRYFLFSSDGSNREVVGDNLFDEDGHPSYSPDGRLILTDTYPDRSRYRSLIIYDTETASRFDIARFFASFKYSGEERCDLHPRWSRDGRQICFDSVHEGKRQLYLMDNPFKGE